jgi:hypothetical protein
MLASLSLTVSAALSLSGSATPAGDAAAALRARGWQETGHLVCGDLRPGAYYEAGNEESSAELLALPGGGALVSGLLPDPPYACREIPGPQFVEEIR